MGKLIEQKLPTLYGGVSKQPPSVRRANQHEDQTNALSSIVSGGFEKRPATQLIAAVSTLSASSEYHVHPIDRDATEQLFVFLDGTGDIQVYDTIAGTQKTVTIGDSKRYFLIEATNVDATGVMDTSSLTALQADGWDSSDRYQIKHADTQFDWNWQLTDSGTQWDLQGSADGSVWNNIQSNVTGATSGSFSTTVDAVATGDHNYIRINIDTAAGSSTDTLTLWATYKDKTYLFQGIDGPEDFAAVSVADFTFIANRNVTARLEETTTGTVTDTARTTAVGTPPAGIPAPSGSGDIYKIVDDTDKFATYYVQDDTTDDLWVEAANPNGQNAIDASSMPHQLVREADGTFTFKAATYADREVGDAVVAPAPEFIGKTIADVVFFRNRLGILADEKVKLSRSALALNFWPQKAIETLDTDPIDRAATTTSVNLLKYATVFRKLLFVTGERAQFEMSSLEAFTPTTAAFDEATTYPASAIAEPVSMGDVLFFPSSAVDHAVIYEYFFDQTTLGNTAADVTKHVQEYIPEDIIQMAADSQSGTLYVLSSGEQNSLFVYRVFFDGNEKLMSSWSKFTYGATEAKALIHGFTVFSGFMVMLVEREDGFYLEQAQINREEANSTLGYIPLIDQRETQTGTYDSTNEITSWTPTWDHDDDVEVVAGPSFATIPGQRFTVLYPDQYTLTLASVTAGQTIIINGLTFTAHATTTTTANREFSISGNDSADGDELVTVINDATDGVPGVTAANASGVVTITVDDARDTTITAPTGTAVGATVTSAELNNEVQVAGDQSEAASYLGRQYNMDVDISQQYVREDGAQTVINGRLQLRRFTFQYEDSGFFSVHISDDFRTDDRVFEFTGRQVDDIQNVVGDAPIDDEGAFSALVEGRSDRTRISVQNSTPFPSVITAAAWTGFFSETARNT